MTWRVSVEEPPELSSELEEKIPVILAHWHGDELVLISLAKRYKIATITSLSSDGSMMDFVLKLLGAKTSRGSSSRGGVQALKGLIKLSQQGHNCSFAVDGPKGPIHQAKPGVFEVSKIMASKSGGNIFCAGVAAQSAWIFEKSWNKTYLPKPFSKIFVRWALAVPALKKDHDPKSLEFKNKLEVSLHQVQEQARRKI